MVTLTKVASFCSVRVKLTLKKLVLEKVLKNLPLEQNIFSLHLLSIRLERLAIIRRGQIFSKSSQMEVGDNRFKSE